VKSPFSQSALFGFGFIGRFPLSPPWPGGWRLQA